MSGTISSSLTPRITTVSSLSDANPAARGRVDPAADRGELVHPRQRAEALAIERVQADGDAMEPGRPQRVRLSAQQDAVGRERQIGDRAPRREPFDEARQIAAKERLAAGNPHPVHAERREDVHDGADFLERQQALARQPHVVRLRHTVKTPEVAAIRDRDPEAAQRAREAIDERHGSPKYNLLASALRASVGAGSLRSPVRPRR